MPILSQMVVRDDLFAWSALTRAPGLNTATLSRALEQVGSPSALVAAGRAELDRAGIPDVAARFLASPDAMPTAAEQHWLDDPRHHLLPFTDVRYPPLLRSVLDCPLALYVSGNVDVLADPQLAVVGSRNPTASGRTIAFEFAETLAVRGLGILSGLAEGIDAAAHRGALQAAGITVAVLGTGIDRVYPACNQGLSETIEQWGALITEFGWGTPPKRGNFPRRNKIIATLSLGTLVVEAARRSGSLITARQASEQGREVFAVPGSIHNPLSRGCHELIKSGAKLVENSADVLSELNFSMHFDGGFRAAKGARSPAAAAPGMDKDHKILLDALGFDPVDLDTLVVRTGFKPEAVSSMMLILELEGHVQVALGGRYSRTANRRAVGER